MDNGYRKTEGLRATEHAGTVPPTKGGSYSMLGCDKKFTVIIVPRLS